MQIRVRAWHKTQKKMYSPEEMAADQLTLMPDGRGFINVHGRDTSLSKIYDHMVPLLSTGLRDKTGREIYAEDIVMWVDSDKQTRIDVVQFAFAKFFLCNNSHSLYEYIGNSLIVVGNVYENPDILKGES